MKYRLNYLLAVLAAVGIVSCSKDDGKQEQGGNDEPRPEVEVVSAYPEEVSLDSEGGSFTFTVLANYDWKVSCPGWMSVDPAFGKGDKTPHEVTVNVSGYEVETEDRTGEISVSLPQGETVFVSVFQLRKEHIDPAPTSIASAEDFALWTAYYASSETGTMTLENDIDMAGVDFVPVSAFGGTFDGKGHTIRNLKSSKPIFITLSGTVKDLTLDAGCEFSASDIDYCSSFAGTLGGTLSGCTNNGGIVVSGQKSAKYAGGLCAYTNAGSVIENCTNNGDVSYTPSSHTSDIFYGGLVGYNTGELKGCVNNGDVVAAPESPAAGKISLGGFAGSGKTGHADKCVNTGRIDCHFSGSLSSEVRIGGFIGEGITMTCAGCSQFGDVSCPVAKSNYRVGGLMGFQSAVSDGKDYNIFEDCVVNCTVTGCQGESAKVPANAGGNDVGSSTSMIVGRMSGQSGKTSNLYFGTTDKPVKMAGTLVSTGDVEKSVTISADNYKRYVCGGGSATNYAGDPANPCTWQVFNAVYQVVNK